MSPRTMSGRAIAVGAGFGLGMLLVLAGCTPMPRDGDAGIASGIPVEAPSIRGQITAMPATGSLLIEADPAQASGSDKAAVRLAADARVWHRDGRAATADDLAVGQTVSAWFTGPVRESYPVQADARVVVIER